MRILRCVCTLSSLTLLLWLGAAAFGAPRPQGDNRQDQAKPAEQPKPQEALRPQEQPRPQAQPRPQEAPRPQAQTQPRPQAQPKPQEQPRAQAQPKPQAQPRPQEQARPQEQPKPQQNRAPQQNAREAQPNENRSAAAKPAAPARQQAARPQGGGRPGGAQQGHTTPTAQERQQARSYQSAKRVAPAQERTIFQQRRATNWGADHRDWAARGGYVGFRVPDARFNLYFGPSHFFHVYSLPLVYVGGYPEFYYQGYWWEMLDPVPPDWSATWFQTDNLWINWEGGYYLYDSVDPNESVAVEPVSN